MTQQARVVFPANKVFTSEYGDSQNIKFQLIHDGTEGLVWFDSGKEPFVSLKAGDIIDVYQTESGRWKIAEATKPSLQRKEAILETANDLYGLYEHFLNLATALTANLNKPNAESIVSVANTLMQGSLALSER